jgi:hypothetical protein
MPGTWFHLPPELTGLNPCLGGLTKVARTCSHVQFWRVEFLLLVELFNDALVCLIATFREMS